MVITSNKGRKKYNDKTRYIIYPELSKFRKACFNCVYREVKDKRSSCRLKDKDFTIKYYGFIEAMPKGIVLSLGAVPTG